MKKASLLLIVAASALRLALGGVTGAQDNRKRVVVQADAIKTAIEDKGTDRKAVLRGLGQEWNEFGASLDMMLTNAKDDEQKAVYIYLMGLYRTEGAAQELAKIVNFEAKMDLIVFAPVWSRQPAAQALVRIGKPAVGPMLRNIEEDRDLDFRETSANVLLAIEGKKVARFLVEDRLSTTTDDGRRKRLQETLDYYKKLERR